MIGATASMAIVPGSRIRAPARAGCPKPNPVPRGSVTSCGTTTKIVNRPYPLSKAMTLVANAVRVTRARVAPARPPRGAGSAGTTTRTIARVTAPMTTARRKIQRYEPASTISPPSTSPIPPPADMVPVRRAMVTGRRASAIVPRTML